MLNVAKKDDVSRAFWSSTEWKHSLNCFIAGQYVTGQKCLIFLHVWFDKNALGHVLPSLPVFPSPPQTPPLHHRLPLTTVLFLPSPTKSSTSTPSTGRRCSAGENSTFQSVSVTLIAGKTSGKSCCEEGFNSHETALRNLPSPTSSSPGS